MSYKSAKGLASQYIVLIITVLVFLCSIFLFVNSKVNIEQKSLYLFIAVVLLTVVGLLVISGMFYITRKMKSLNRHFDSLKEDRIKDTNVFPELDALIKKIVNKNSDNEIIFPYDTEEKQKNSKISRYKDFIDGLPTACAIFNEKLELVFLNKSSYVLFADNTKNNLLGKHIKDIIKNINEPELVDIPNRVLETGKSFYSEKFSLKTSLGKVNSSINIFKLGQGVGVTISDISQQKKTESKLIESQKNLKRAQKLARIGNWRWDKETQSFIISNEVFNILGITSNTNFRLELNQFLRGIHPKDKAHILKKMRSGETDNLDSSFDFRYLNKGSNKLLYLHCIWKQETTPKGDKVYYGTLQDITKNKKIELKLGEISHRFNILVNSIDEIFWIADIPFTKYYYVSPTFEKKGPISTKEAMNDARFLFKYIHPEDRDLILNAISKPEENKSFNFVYRVISPEGELIWFHAIGKIIRHPINQELRIVGTTRDISSIKAQEFEKIKLAAAVEQSSDGILIMDMNGNINYFNSSFERISGVEREHLINKPFFGSCVNLSMNDFSNDILPQIEAGIIWSGKISGIKKNGDHFPANLTLTPIKNNQDRIDSILGIINDITKQEAFETQVRHAQKMETIGTLTSGISHDFNNILATIQGYLQLSMESVEKGSALESYLNQILKASSRAAHLVKQILNFSRKSELSFYSLNANSIIDEALELIKPSVSPDITVKKYELNSRYQQLQGNSNQLNQVFLNLLTNALYAMKKSGGLLEVKIEDFIPDDEFIEIYRDFNRIPHIKITVRDTGEGMSKEVMEKIFDPFYTTKPVGEGTGLGLSVVHGIIENHNGVIHVQSKQNEGTAFELFFPCSDMSNKMLSEEIEEHLVNNLKVAVAVVDKSLSMSLSKNLAKYGMKVEEFETGLDLKIALCDEGSSFNLLIVDQELGDIDGVSLILEGTKINHSIRSILISKLFTEDIEQLKKNHNIQFVSYPFSFSSIQKALIKLFQEPK
ncbi:MAG: PAS domain S-box protein [Hyphomicrobiales bacterium]